MGKLELPLTIQFATIEDVPRTNNLIDRISKIPTAKIVEGYTIQKNVESFELPFEFFSEINVNSTRLWQVVVSLSELMPDEASTLAKHIDDETKFGKYQKLSSLIDRLQALKLELVNDCYLDWGVIYSSASELVEILVDNSKYVKFWGANEVRFREILEELGIMEVKDLEFVDEYPKIRFPIGRIFENASTTTSTIDYIVES